MKKISMDDLNSIKFMPFNELLLPDNDKVKEIKSFMEEKLNILIS